MVNITPRSCVQRALKTLVLNYKATCWFFLLVLRRIRVIIGIRIVINLVGTVTKHTQLNRRTLIKLLEKVVLDAVRAVSWRSTFRTSKITK